MLKAYNASLKNYGFDSIVTKNLLNSYNQQEHFISSMDRNSHKNKAITEIVDAIVKKNMHANAFYAWEDEKIVLQLVKTKGI